MRRRLVLSTVAVVTVVILVLLVPVLLIVRNAAESELQSRLDQQLTSITTAYVGDDPPSVEVLDDIVNDGDGVRIVSADGEVRVERDIGRHRRRPSRRRRPVRAARRSELVTSGEELNERFQEQVVRLGDRRRRGDHRVGAARHRAGPPARDAARTTGPQCVAPRRRRLQRDRPATVGHS